MMLELDGFGRARERRVRRAHYDRRVFRGNEVVKCSMLKEMELMAGEVLRLRATNNRVTRFGGVQQAGTARFERRLKYY